MSGSVDACDDYFTRARAHLLEREREYAGLIDVLRETVRRLGKRRDRGAAIRIAEPPPEGFDFGQERLRLQAAAVDRGLGQHRGQPLEQLAIPRLPRRRPAWTGPVR